MRRLAAALLLLALASCSDGTGPPPPDLTGTWSGTVSNITWTMSLYDYDQVVSGTCVLSAGGNQLTATVAGSHRHPNFAFTMSAPGYYSIGFAGLASANQLKGVIVGSGFEGDSLVMYRR